MSYKWFAIRIIITGLVILLLSQAYPVYAQEPTPENDANCVACHEHQYYLYDSGKWFCLCDAPMHCVYCHNGRTDTNNKELAHEGLVLYPTRHNAEGCRSCHPEDYLSRVVTFATVAGVSSTPQTIATATLVGPVAAAVQAPPSPPLFRLNQLETWRQVGLGILAVALLGITIFGFRCWKADCLPKIQL